MTKELPKELLEMLAYPTCRGKLAYQQAKQELVCKKCGNYPIKNGIPMLLPK